MIDADMLEGLKAMFYCRRIDSSFRGKVEKLPPDPLRRLAIWQKGSEGYLAEGGFLTPQEYCEREVLAYYQSNRGVGGTMIPDRSIVRLNILEVIAYTWLL